VRNPHALLTAAAVLSLLASCGDAGAPPRPTEAATAPTAASAPASASPRAAAAPPCANPGAGPEPDAGGLRALVRKRSGPLRDCYQRALKRDPSAGGKATLRFTIGVCGQLSDVAVASRSGRVDEAAACAVRSMRGWSTPFRPSEPVTVEYPVAFSPSM
jgi:TonB family protein